MAAQFEKIYRLLSDSRIDFILIGGGAANLHGTARLTLDVDVVYSRTPENLRRISDALGPVHSYPRGAPPGLPFKLDFRTLKNGLNFTLTTDLGDLDLFGEVPAGGTFEEMLPFTHEVDVMGICLRCVNLEKLIELKRSAGRPKDNEAIAELEAIRQEKQRLEAEDS